MTMEEYDTQANQALFDKVVEHLAAQGGPSLSEKKDESGNGCAYRGKFDRMCAVGALIEDEYDPSMEGKSACDILPEYLQPYEPLLSELQQAHDDARHSRRRKAMWTYVGKGDGDIATRLINAAHLFRLDPGKVYSAFGIAAP